MLNLSASFLKTNRKSLSPKELYLTLESMTYCQRNRKDTSITFNHFKKMKKIDEITKMDSQWIGGSGPVDFSNLCLFILQIHGIWVRQIIGSFTMKWRLWDLFKFVFSPQFWFQNVLMLIVLFCRWWFSVPMWAVQALFCSHRANEAEMK